MKIQITSTINVKAIMKRKGLGPDNALRKYVAARVWLRSDPYVPKKQGILKNTAQIAPDGSAITYAQPYAHYQFTGKVYGPNVLTRAGWRSMAKKGAKYPTGRSIRYTGAPMRGPHWDERMMADHRKDVEADVAAYLRGEDGGGGE